MSCTYVGSRRLQTSFWRFAWPPEPNLFGAGKVRSLNFNFEFAQHLVSDHYPTQLDHDFIDTVIDYFARLWDPEGSRRLPDAQIKYWQVLCRA